MDQLSPSLDGARYSVVVVGGGQAGLSMSYCLGQRGVDHLVLEAQTPGHEWADRRWDTFCLVTPNWQCTLPGYPYAGDDPHGFMVRDDIVRYLDGYVRFFAPPLAQRTAATRLTRRGRGGFEIRTSRGTLTADQVVIATGPCQVPLIPRIAHRRAIEAFDDVDAVRFRANHYVTGRDGGRDIDLRAFARDGMSLHGRLAAIGAGTVSFGGDLRGNLDRADAVAESIKDSVDAYIAARRITAPAQDRYQPVWQPPDGPTEIDLGAAGISTVIWATGFGRDSRWIEVPVFDGRGYPTHRRGVTSCEGLYFLGLPWQHTWGSGRFCGVGDDAAYLADRICAGPLRDVHWLAGTPASTWPRDEDWAAPRTVA